MLAVLIGCGLRRGELLALRLESLQQREEHWVVADLVGKGGHVRTVPVPTWVKATIDTWTTAAGITHGAIFRAINKTGRIWGDGMTPKVLWDVVRAAAVRADIEKLAPHDLPTDLRALVPLGRRRTRSDSVSAWSCLDPDYRAIPWVQAEASSRSVRHVAHRTRAHRVTRLKPGRTSERPPFATTRFLSVVRTNRSIASRVRSVHRGRLGDFIRWPLGHRVRISRPELLSW